MNSPITPEVTQQVIDLAASTEEEICGYIAADGSFVYVENTYPDPTKGFAFDTAQIPAGALGIVHSHPGGPHWPSHADMQSQIALNLPWGIAAISDQHKELFWFGDGLQRAPLVGRAFRHGVTDCYSLIRDFYLMYGQINLPEFPREWEWWLNDEQLYEQGFPEAGFTPVDKRDAKPGDVVFFNIHSRTPNHAGVYLGNGLLLHHVASKQGFDPSRLSVWEPLGRWSNLINRVLRHEDHLSFRPTGSAIQL